MDFDFTEEQLAVSEAAASIFQGMADRRAGGGDREPTADRFDDDAVVGARQGEPPRPGRPRGARRLGPRPHRVVPRPRATGPRRGAGPAVGHRSSSGPCPWPASARAEQQARWLPGVARASVRLSAALNEVAASARQPRPRCAPSATVTAGDCTAPPSPSPRRIWPPASSSPPPSTAPAPTAPSWLSSIPPAPAPPSSGRRPPTTRSTPISISTGCPVPAAEVLAGPDDGAGAVAWMLDRARTGLCAIQLGVTEEAVRRAAAYLNQRHQFGRPLSSFQGTMLRAADAYIDTEAIRVTMWQAAWRIDDGPPGHRSGGRGPLVGLGGGATRRARHPAPPRRPRGRHLLPDPPLLPVGQADRAHAAGPERRAGPPGLVAGDAATQRRRRRSGWRDREPGPH